MPLPIVALQFADRNNEQFRSARVLTGVSLTVTPKHIGDQFVTLDVKPGGDPNSINLGSAGVIPVAVLSDDTFDSVVNGASAYWVKG